MNKNTGNSTSLCGLAAGTTWWNIKFRKKWRLPKVIGVSQKQFTTHIAVMKLVYIECGITPDFSLKQYREISEVLTKGDYVYGRRFSSKSYSPQAVLTAGLQYR